MHPTVQGEDIYKEMDIYICRNRLLNMSAPCITGSGMIRSPAASKGATEAPTCIPLNTGRMYVYV